jgi:hypothetical protein
MQTFTGIEYLKIDVANCFGEDKRTWQERLDWFDAGSSFDLSYADDDLLAEKALNAYQDALDGVPTGHVMYLDATFSGAQIIACLMGCKTTAEQVNLVNTGRREDGYTNATTQMNKYVEFSVERPVMKSALMPSFYGSKEKPLEVFGEGEELDAFNRAAKECFPGAVEYLNDVPTFWQSDALYHQWTMPDQAVVRVRVKKEVKGTKIEIDELGCSFTHNATVNEATESGTTLQANIVQSTDAWIEREMIRRANAQGFDLLCIFDAFGASPNHMNKVRQNYIDILCELADMDLLGSILSEISGEPIEVSKDINNLSDYIRESEYPLS